MALHVADETALIYVGGPASFESTPERSLPRVDAFVDRQIVCTGAAVATSLEIADVRFLASMCALVFYKMVASTECSCTTLEVTGVGLLTRVCLVMISLFAWRLKHFTASLPRACVPPG